MNLVEATFVNFMPYKGSQNVVFPSPGQGNVMLIFGDNMRGKTSFLNALRWCFFGKLKGRHLNTIPLLEAVNVDAAKSGDWNMSVRLEFDHDGFRYDLRRSIGLKESVYAPKNDNDFAQNVYLKKEGEPLSPNQIKHELNQIIPEDVSRFFLFDGELLQEYEVLLQEQTHAGKLIKESIEKILGVPALVNGRDDLDLLLRVARKEQGRDASRIEGLKVQADKYVDIQTNQDSLRTDIQQLETKHKEISERVKSLDETIENNSVALANKESYDRISENLSSAEGQERELSSQKAELLRDAWLDLLQPRLGAYLKGLNQKEQTERANEKKLTLARGEIERLKKLLIGNPCETCGEILHNARRDEISSRLGILEANVMVTTQDYSKLHDLTTRLVALSNIRSRGALERVTSIEKELGRISTEIIKLENEKSFIYEKIKSHDTAELSRIRATRDKLQKEVGALERDILEQRKNLEENERKQQQLQAILGQNQQARSQRTTKLVDAYTILKNIFGESIEDLRTVLRIRVEERATEAFRNLTTETTFKRLGINESYGLRIFDRDEREVRQRSAGAEQIVALALIDGLNRTSRTSGPIVMDTPLGRLDLKHRANVLKYIPQMAQQVILLVHEGEILRHDILDVLKERVGGVYDIRRISSSESRIERSVET